MKNRMREICTFGCCRSKNDPVTGGGGRSHQGKMLVVGAVEVEDGGRGPGRIRLGQVADYSAASLHPFLADTLAPGATAKTDGCSGYTGAAGITHIVLPWVHRIFFRPQGLGLGRLSRSAPPAPPILPR